MENRFIIQKSEKPNYWVVTDVENDFVVIFEEKKYNETNKITPLNNKLTAFDFMKIAKINREIGEWLVLNYPNLI